MSDSKRGFRLARAVVLTGGALLVLAVVLAPNLVECVVAGTLVATPSGERPIESLRVGDEVVCMGPTGQLVTGRVKTTYPARVEEHLELVFGDRRRLGVTASHPVATAGGEWVLAGDLRPGQRVRTREGVVSLVRVEEQEAATVYDLTVTPYANFFAGGVLVHNKRRMGNEGQAIGALKTIRVAQDRFRDLDLDRDGVADYGTLAELLKADLISSSLGSGSQAGYLFEVTQRVSGSEFVWFAAAAPEVPGTTGDRYFVSDHRGITFFTTQERFLVNSTDFAIPPNVRPVGR
jgi:hypothetical protein